MLITDWWSKKLLKGPWYEIFDLASKLRRYSTFILPVLCAAVSMARLCTKMILSFLIVEVINKDIIKEVSMTLLCFQQNLQSWAGVENLVSGTLQRDSFTRLGRPVDGFFGKIKSSRYARHIFIFILNVVYICKIQHMCAWPLCFPPPRRKVTRREIAPEGIFYALRAGCS
jgi:hypothetical protein